MFSEIHCVAKGRVQGVGYRYFVERYAEAQGLFGWVRNNNDGSVELVLQGTPDALKEAISALNQGSPLAKVESLSVEWGTPSNQYDEFKVIAS